MDCLPNCDPGDRRLLNGLAQALSKDFEDVEEPGRGRAARVLELSGADGVARISQALCRPSGWPSKPLGGARALVSLSGPEGCLGLVRGWVDLRPWGGSGAVGQSMWGASAGSLGWRSLAAAGVGALCVALCEVRPERAAECAMELERGEEGSGELSAGLALAASCGSPAGWRELSRALSSLDRVPRLCSSALRGLCSEDWIGPLARERLGILEEARVFSSVGTGRSSSESL